MDRMPIASWPRMPGCRRLQRRGRAERRSARLPSLALARGGPARSTGCSRCPRPHKRACGPSHRAHRGNRLLDGDAPRHARGSGRYYPGTDRHRTDLPTSAARTGRRPRKPAVQRAISFIEVRRKGFFSCRVHMGLLELVSGSFAEDAPLQQWMSDALDWFCLTNSLRTSWMGGCMVLFTSYPMGTIHSGAVSDLTFYSLAERGFVHTPENWAAGIQRYCRIQQDDIFISFERAYLMKPFIQKFQRKARVCHIIEIDNAYNEGDRHAGYDHYCCSGNYYLKWHPIKPTAHHRPVVVVVVPCFLDSSVVAGGGNSAYVAAC